jgi:polyhydroxyalkanoate synthesis repressor PhaR
MVHRNIAKVTMPNRSPSEKAPRLIKKYPNRRLYDTKTSAYITLDDVRGFVVSGDKFQVVDAKSEENLTRSILLQIILEAEASGAPMFTEEALSHMIRFYGNAFQGAMGPFLEQNIRAFLDMQTKLQEQNRAMFTGKGYNPDAWAQLMNTQNPAMQAMMGSYVEQSKTVFAQMQEAMQAQSRAMFGGFGLGDTRGR